MKYLIPVMIIAAFLGGCKSRVDGQLNVTKEISLREFSGEKQAIKVGTYTADLSSNGANKIALRLNNDNNQRFNFAIPENSRLPENGTVVYSAAQVNQAVDVKATIVTNVTNSQPEERWTSCTYQAPTQVCYPLPTGGMNCTIQYQTVWGQQWTRFYNRITDKNVTFDISEPNSTEVSAEFLGDAKSVDQIILNQSPCR